MKRTKTAAPVRPAAPARRNLATLRAAHDPAVIVPTKIRAALEIMRKKDGDEAYAYEFSDPAGTPFTKLADVSVVHLSAYRNEFADHIVTVKQDTGSRRGPRFVWFATVKGAKAAVAAGFAAYEATA